MGNLLSCTESGERLAFAARNGDLSEARMLLQSNPRLAKYCTLGGLNSALHYSASNGHDEIAALLLENGADVNWRNYCGETALMQACKSGHWEVVQTLLIYRANVTKAEYLSSRTALHFAAMEGHVKCIRLLVADFIPSAPFELISNFNDYDVEKGSNRGSTPNRIKFDQLALSKFVNKLADGGLTALHLAALNGDFNCIHLLLDLGANIAAVTVECGTSMNLIGPGSTALHYAACGGDLKCCQLLLARGASRLTLNSNGWLPVDIAKIWSRHCLEPLLLPNSNVAIPAFALSNYLALPLMSILNIAREPGMRSSATPSEDADPCAVCLEKTCNVAAEGCGHELCVKCALYLCSTTNVHSESVNPPGSIPCPLCRSGIVSFIKLPSTPGREIKSDAAFTTDMPTIGTISENLWNWVTAVSSELMCPLSCSPFSYAVIPSCTCDDNTSTNETNGESEDQPPSNSQSVPEELVMTEEEEERDDTTSCSVMFWCGRRSSQRKHQCNLEMNT